MKKTDPSRGALTGVRRMIDGVDDALLTLIVARRRLVSLAARIKQDKGVPIRDPDREQEVLQRARRLGNHLGLPAASSDRLMTALIQDACGQQGFVAEVRWLVAIDTDQGARPPITGMLANTMNNQTRFLTASRWLRLLPPPSRLSPFLRRIPISLAGDIIRSGDAARLECAD